MSTLQNAYKKLSELKKSVEKYGQQLNADRLVKEVQKVRSNLTAMGLKKYNQMNRETNGAVQMARKEYLRVIEILEQTRKQAESEMKTVKTTILKRSDELEKQFSQLHTILHAKKKDLEKRIKKNQAVASPRKTSTKKASKSTKKVTVSAPRKRTTSKKTTAKS